MFFFNRQVKVKVDLLQNLELIRIDLLRVWKEVKVVNVMNEKKFGTNSVHVWCEIRWGVRCRARCSAVRDVV